MYISGKIYNWSFLGLAKNAACSRHPSGTSLLLSCRVCYTEQRHFHDVLAIPFASDKVNDRPQTLKVVRYLWNDISRVYVSVLSMKKLHSPSCPCIKPLYRPKRVCYKLKANKGSLDQPPAFIPAGPADPSPDYKAIDASLLNKSITHLFRQRMVAKLGADSQLQGYISITNNMLLPRQHYRSNYKAAVCEKISFPLLWHDLKACSAHCCANGRQRAMRIHLLAFKILGAGMMRSLTLQGS